MGLLLLLDMVVNIFQVATEVTALCECLATKVALKRPLASVLPKMITQVARLLED